jgi:hypothetical protein
MPVCHKCKHQREIDRLRKICSACPGASDNFGRNVHFQASPDGTGELVLGKGRNRRVAPDWQPNEPTESRVAVPPEARVYLFRLLQEFSQLTDAQASIACRMLRGETIIQMSRGMGMTKEAVFARWKSLCAQSPVWASLSNGSMGLRGGGRKPVAANKQGDVQLELFA